MSKRRKKRSSAQQRKQEQAEQRKKFYRKVKLFFALIEKEHLFGQISERELQYLWKLRMRAPKVQPEDGCTLSAKHAKMMTEALYYYLNDYKLDIPGADNQINAYEYLTTGLTIYSFILLDPNPDFPKEDEFYDEMSPITNNLFGDELELMIKKLKTILGMVYDGIDIHHYPVRFEWGGGQGAHQGVFAAFRVNRVANPFIHIKAGGSRRPAFQVGFAVEDFVPLQLKAEILHLETSEYPEPLNVYIQSHALRRLGERVDLLAPGELRWCMYDSLAQPAVIPYRHNSYLIEYRMLGYKIGYLVADLVKSKLIIRTFLLVTQCGTPEEQKLCSITGLSKEDIAYLNLCKLSSFVNSDIHENQRLKIMFEEAGCGPILAFAKDKAKKPVKKVPRAEQILDYLKVETPMLEFELNGDYALRKDGKAYVANL
ncbi:hypothetical protein [Prolixibacter sp. SD074]|jgi:hypothetical protein|uniref:hypothetical protein n=1 Tax=Prolixibacter sp. SD074 TaxID=2652391 RepID=UPI00128227EF|nr:hypothetical protein [Prolixibacter sp. SD074]GET28013.1 hypothetical protein SD074_02150 [Prolixibacter sp. SD074]